MQHKTCPQCKEVKPLTEFRIRKYSPTNKPYYSWCKLCERIVSNNYYSTHKEDRDKYAAEYRKKNPEKYRKTLRDSQLKLRIKVLSVYSNNNIQCGCCKETEMKFMAIDHINGGGAKHNKEIKRTGSKFYQWLRVNNYPVGFQVLCHNCNMAKGLYGECPHRSIKSITEEESSFAHDLSK